MIKRNNSFGFTLIEMLVSIAIIITTTTVVVAILASSFSGITRSAVSEDVRQNGNNAITRMTRTVQFAQSFQGVSKDNVDYETDCEATEGDRFNYLKVMNNSQTTTISCTDSDIIIGPSSIIDKSKVSVVESSCSFTCIQDNSLVSPVIKIDFGLYKAGIENSRSTETYFSTSVKMRNL